MPSTIFFTKIIELKKNEQWEEIISLGKIILLKKDLLPEKAALICIEMARCFYYMGYHDYSLKACATADRYRNEIQNSIEHNITIQNLKAAYYCLLLENYIMLALTADNNKDDYVRASFQMIDPLLQFNSRYLELELDGKIKLVLGLSTHKLKKDYNEAELLYAKAIDIFERAISIESKPELTSNLHFAKIKFISVLLESNKATALECLKYTDEIKEKINYGSRIWIHFLILKTQIMMALKDNNKASQAAHEALDRSSCKHMLTETKQITSMLRDIESISSLNIIKHPPDNRRKCTIL